MNTRATDADDAEETKRTCWHLDPTRTEIEFRVKNLWGLATVKGTFSRARGWFDLNARPAVELILDAASIDTRNPRRDKHLRSADFFGAEAHPEVRFVSQTASLDGERLRVQGRLYARGTSMPLSLDATLRRIGGELEVTAEGEADQRELGMTWNALGMVRTPSLLAINGRLVRADAGSRP